MNEYTFGDLELARRILVRLGWNPDAYPHRAEWIAEEIANHREIRRRADAATGGCLHFDGVDRCPDCG